MRNNYYIIVITFFIIFFAIGVCIFKDYGVGWDEGNNHHYGYLVLNYILGDKQGAEQFVDPLISDRNKRFIYYLPRDNTSGFWDPVTGQFAKTHGPVFEVLLVSIEKFLNLRDSQKIYFLRHIAIFMMFYIGAVFFYKLCRYAFDDWKIGILGSLFLVLSPRIFSHSFHNSVDISFLSMFIVSMYTLIRFLEKKNILWASIHAIACAITVDIRIAGIMIPFITFVLVIFDIIASNFKKVDIKKIVWILIIYSIIFITLSTLLWPMLWGNPFRNFIAAFKASATDPWDWWELYFGNKTYGQKVPWHFTPVWLFITTPPIYTVFFFIGLLSLIKSIWGIKKFYPRIKVQLIAIFCFFGPLIAVALFKTTLFNGWRHMFFIYPGFLLISLTGFLTIDSFIKKSLQGLRYKIINGLFIFIIFCSLAFTVSFMIRSHPYQNVYFNWAIGGLKNAKGQFDIGYWGVELREAFEYILKNDKNKIINYRVDNPNWTPVVLANASILPEGYRLNFITEESYVNEPLKHRVDYLVTNYYNYSIEHEFEEIWSRKVDGVKIVTVYKLTD